MPDYSNLQHILVNKAEPIYREFRDANGNLTTPTTPYVRIYNPDAVIVSSGTPTAESTGVYYHTLTLNTAGVLEGVYQAFWEGTIGAALVTMDIPQFLLVTKFPWQAAQQNAFAQSVRRLIGDTNPNNYRISIQDMYYFIQDAVERVQTRMDFGYILTVTPTAMTWNKVLTNVPSALFKLQTLILVLENTFYDGLYEGASVQVGDIKVDITSILKLRKENIEKLKEDFEKLLYEVKMNYVGGHNIDTYVRGLIVNDYNTEFWVYE